MDLKFQFEAQGYLAISPHQTDETGALLGRRWLATSKLADIRLTLEQSSLILVVSVKDTVYVRITMAEIDSNGMLQQGELVLSLSARRGRTATHRGQAPLAEQSWRENDDSERLKSLVQDLLKDPDLPDLVRMVEEIWGQMNVDPLGW